MLYMSTMDDPTQISIVMQLLDSLDEKISSACISSGGSATRRLDELSFTKLESIDSRIVGLLRKARSWRNMNVMINKLPPEVLAHIFDCCQVGKIMTMVPPDFSLIWITMVCRHWRDIALQFPMLWTYVDTGHEKNALISIQRSGVAPLRVFFREPWAGLFGRRWEKVSDSCKEALSAHSARFRELFIRSYGADLERDDRVMHLHHLDQPAPELQTLALSTYVTEHALKMPVLFTQYPKLKRLSLENVSDWSGNNFQDLTHLSLSKLSGYKKLPHQLHSVLSASPSLRELFLTFHMLQSSVSQGRSESQFSPVVLDHLQTLYVFGGNLSPLAPLISHLTVPPGVTVYFHNTCVAPWDILKLFPNNLGGIRSFEKLRVEFNGQRLNLCGVSGSTVFSHRLRLRPDVMSPLVCLSRIFDEPCAASSLKELQLKHPSSPASDELDWSRPFRRLSSLEKLVLLSEEYVPDGIIAGLLPYRRATGDIEVPCPDLAVLEVLCPPMKGGPIPSLALAIKQRRDNCCSIQVLRLSQAYMGIPPEMQNNVTVDIVAHPHSISETDFEEVLNMEYYVSQPAIFSCDP